MVTLIVLFYIITCFVDRFSENSYLYHTVKFCIVLGKMVTLIVLFNIVTCFVDRANGYLYHTVQCTLNILFNIVNVL